MKGTSAANSANHTHSGTTASAKPELTGSTVITADGTTVSISDSVALNQTEGGGQAHSNLPPYTVLNYIICVR